MKTGIETVMTERGPAPVYHAGTLAYLDSFAGMIPCTVTNVITPGFGYVAAGPVSLTGEIQVRINVTRGGYARAEVITCSAHDIVPRAQHYYRSGTGRINSLYVWR